MTTPPRGFYGDCIDDPSMVVASRWYQMPTGSSSPVRKDRPIDAADATFMVNNHNHLARESLRHLVSAPGPGVIGYQGFGWDDLVDGPTYVSVAGVGSFFIAWSRRTAMKFPAFHAILDRPSPSGSPPLPRRVRVDVDVHLGASHSLTLVVALTEDGRTPTEGALALRYTGDAGPVINGTQYLALPLIGSGDQTFSVVLDPAGNIRPATDWTSRPAATGRPGTTTRVLPVTLWVGWASLHAADEIIDVNAYEWPHALATPGAVYTEPAVGDG